MNKSLKKRMLVIGCVLVVIGLIISCISFAVMGFSMRAFYRPSGQVSEPEVLSFTGEQIMEIDIDAKHSIIEVEGVEGLKSPELVISEDLYEYQLESGSMGQRLVVRDTGDWKNGGWHWYQIITIHNSENSRVILRLPQDFEGRLKLNSDFGGITAGKLTALDSGAFVCANGDVEINSLKADGGIMVKSSFGGIYVADSKAKEFNLHNESGDVELKSCQGDETVLSTSFGGVSIDSCSLGSVDLKSANGDTYLNDISVQKRLDYESRFGSLTFKSLECPDIRLESANGDVEGVLIGRENDYEILAITELGDSNLRNSKGGEKTLEIDLKFGSIEIEFADN